MKKAILVFLTLGAVLASGLSVYSADTNVSAKAAILIDADTKQVLYSKNEHQKLPMASTTKIMTALLCLQSEDIDESFVVDKNAIRVEGSSMGLVEGDEVSLKTLAVGMLMLSGNDAANAAAVKISGSIESFSRLMNKTAKQIGMNNSSFVTPSGLDDKNHYSTAYDMALLGAYAIKNAEFLEICSKSKYTVCYGKNFERRTYKNHNRLLKEVEGCIGVKTGFTKKSGRCLVSAVNRNGRTLVAVTLNAPSDWSDHKKLYEYGFSRYKKTKVEWPLKNDRLSVVGSYKDSIKIKPTETELYLLDGEEIKAEVRLREFEFAPIVKEGYVGQIIYKIGKTELLRSALVAIESAPIFSL